MGLFFNKKKESVKQYSTDDFKMHIVDTFAMNGGKTVVVGTIESGVCHVGETVIIHTRYGVITTTIAGLEANHKPLSIGYAGQRIAILLRDITKEQLSKGDMIIIENAHNY